MSKGGLWRWWRALRSGWNLFSQDRRRLVRNFIEVTSSSWGEEEGQPLIFPLWWPVTGLEGIAWSCVRRCLGWISGRGSFPRGCLGTSPRKQSQHPAWQSSSVWKLHMVWLLGMVQCMCRSRILWSLRAPFNSAYAVILWNSLETIILLSGICNWIFSGLKPARISYLRDPLCVQTWSWNFNLERNCTGCRVLLLPWAVASSKADF